MSNLLKIIRNYYSSENTNIFRNYKDALAGAVVMIGLPIVSVFMAVCVEEYTFWNYTFPLLSIREVRRLEKAGYNTVSNLA